MINRLLPICAMMLAFMAGGFLSSYYANTQAQTRFTDDEVIALVANSPHFAPALQAVEEYAGGWTAVTFNTKNAYGIWRVFFTLANGDEIGWADINPQLNRIYSWDIYIGATEEQKSVAMPILKAYLSQHPDILELLDNPAQYDYYVSWEGWADHWGVYIGAGEYALWVTVKFGDAQSPEQLENPRLTGIYFPDLPKYEEWLLDMQAKAVNIAFANAQVGSALRGASWTTITERADGDIWTVAFLVDDVVRVVVMVDIETRQVLEVTTP